MAYKLPFKLNRPDLLITDSYVGGKTASAQSGATFDVLDPGTNQPWIKVTDNSAADADGAVKVAHEAFQSYRKISSRTRAQWLLNLRDGQALRRGNWRDGLRSELYWMVSWGG
ncbi:hypothetical protein NM208_g14318 [Fusarium decemcellulare]|uniref:Uncharacterized protein n=1 Tax=Fusarium decemcellulare TaxID=57161 RepID=A0ACC1RHQ3_9HYPO|nr:hypothetical protein NM208_g14318 [Fusarium decemcellulare]